MTYTRSKLANRCFSPTVVADSNVKIGFCHASPTNDNWPPSNTLCNLATASIFLWIAEWQKFTEHFGRPNSTLLITPANSGPTYTHSGLLVAISTSLPCHNFLDGSCQLTSTKRTRGTHKTWTSPATGKEQQTTPAPSHAVMHARIIIEARVKRSVASIC